MSESINVPLALFLWGAGLYVAAVVALFTVIAHLLIRILTKVNELCNSQTVLAGRLETIERHTSSSI